MQQLIIFVCLGFLIAFKVELAGSTECYQCFSWRDSGCEEDYIVNVNLTTCGVPPLAPTSFWRGDRDRDREREDRNIVLNAPPSTCLKEVIMFIDPPIRSLNDRYNRFNRPWVERKCGNLINSAYRSSRDFVDGCEETEVVIEGVNGIKRSCFCSSDGCNAAVSNQLSGALLSVAVIACILKGI